MTKVVCPDCRHENEPERIYCHNCGARLDRNGVLKEKAAVSESEVQTQKRLKKMFDPKRGRGKLFARQLGKMLLGALACAAVILMLLPPEVPPEPKTYSFAPMINMDLVSAVSSRNPAPLVYSEADVNSYLASQLRRKDSPAGQGYFPVRRIVVQFQEGLCGLMVQRQLFGFSIYSGASYRVALDGGKIHAVATSSFIGRMPVHPTLAKATELFCQRAWTALDRERKSVAKLAGIEFHPQSVALIAVR